MGDKKDAIFWHKETAYTLEGTVRGGRGMGLTYQLTDPNAIYLKETKMIIKMHYSF